MHSTCKVRLLVFVRQFAVLSVFKRGIAIISCPSGSSVRPSVTLMICDHIGWVSSKVITWIIIRVFPPRSLNIPYLVQREQPQNLGGIGAGSLFSVKNLQYLWNGERYDQCYCYLVLITNRKLHTRFWLVLKSTTLIGSPWTAITHFVSKYIYFRSPPQNLNEDRPILSAAKT